MTGPSRDWDKELADIDKLIASTPPAAGQPQAVLRPAERAPVAHSRRELFGAWSRVLLGVVLAAALTQWPYAHRCGLGLLIYLGAAGTVVLAGVWGMVFSWRRRLGLAHVIALGVFLWGAALVAGQVLPRVGYAKAEAAWRCS